MISWKLTAIENQSRLEFLCESEHIAGALAGILARGHAPRTWRGQINPIRFELETVESDTDYEINFNELEEFYKDEPFVDELALEDVEVE